MFYFFTNELGFSHLIMAYLSLVSNGCMLLAVVAYQFWLANISFRRILLWGSILLAVCASTSVLVATHVNRKLKIPDAAFVLGDKGITEAVATIAFFPILVLAARVCKPGVESTLYALLMAILNLGSILAEEFGALLMIALEVGKTKFDNLWLLIVLCSAISLLPLVFLPCLVPHAFATNTTREVDASLSFNTQTATDDSSTADEQAGVLASAADAVGVRPRNPGTIGA